MKNDDFVNKRCIVADRFEIVFCRLLSGEILDLYAEDVSVMFQVIAANLLSEIPERKFHYFDGVVNLNAMPRKSHQIEFTGEMWVGDDRTQWKENFRARVTDKKVTKQGIWITVCVGLNKAEGELSTAFGLS